MFVAWLWGVVATSFFENLGCEWTGYVQTCVRFGNIVGSFFTLFPEALGVAMVRVSPSAFVDVIPVVLCAIAMTWLIFRYLPVRIGLGLAVLLAIGWVAVSVATLAAAARLLFA